MNHIIPVPKHYDCSDESLHSISPSIRTEVADWQTYLDAYRQMFHRIFETELTVNAPGGIELILDGNVAADAYVLDSTDAIRIRSGGSEGMLYGLATVLQLITAGEHGLEVPSVHIEDHPDKEFRAFMFDPGFAIQPFRLLRKYVDLCFLYKVNYLHVHFADNSFYTLPSKAFPDLPSKGHHYSYEQLKQFTDYASSLGIKIIPEFECPGHALLLNKRYRDVFGCHSETGSSEFYNELGEKYSSDALLCAGSDKAFEGVKQLLKEIVEMFPDAPYIHIGGDEAQHELWANCADCQAYMKEHGITSTKELYGEYMGRVASYVLSLGKTPMVWEGFPKFTNHYIPKETVVIAWESHYQLASELLEDGFKIINASWQPMYLVSSLTRRWTPEDILNWNVYNWQHWWPNSYAHLNPITVQPTEQVMGATLCAWGLNYEQLMSRLLENMPAMSERVWTVERKRSFEEYYSSFKKVLKVGAALVQDN